MTFLRVSKDTVRWLMGQAGLGQLSNCNLPSAVTLPNGVKVFARSFDTGGGTCLNVWNSPATVPGAPT